MVLFDLFPGKFCVMVLVIFVVIYASAFLQSSQVSADTSTSSSVTRAEDKVGDSLDEVAGMIRNTLSAYESKVTTSLYYIRC